MDHAAKPASGVLEDTWQGPWLGPAHVGAWSRETSSHCSHPRLPAHADWSMHRAVGSIGRYGLPLCGRGDWALGRSSCNSRPGGRGPTRQAVTSDVWAALAVNSNPKAFRSLPGWDHDLHEECGVGPTRMFPR